MGTTHFLCERFPKLQKKEMVRVRVLNDCLRAIVNAERLGKRQVIIRPSSKVIVKFLQNMMSKGYIGVFEMLGRVNKCGVITPRFDVKIPEIERWVSTLLPSRQFGYIVLTTSEGIMDHEEARKK